MVGCELPMGSIQLATAMPFSASETKYIEKLLGLHFTHLKKIYNQYVHCNIRRLPSVPLGGHVQAMQHHTQKQVKGWVKIN